MNCDRLERGFYRNVLLSYAHRIIEEFRLTWRRKVIERHLESCPPCARFVRAARHELDRLRMVFRSAEARAFSQSYAEGWILRQVAAAVRLRKRGPNQEPLLDSPEALRLLRGSMPGNLELRQQSSGPRHYLDGEPVHAGTGLELLMPDGKWLPGRYEWSFKGGDRPVFYFVLGHPNEKDPDQHVPLAAIGLPPEAILRWPTPEPSRYGLV